MIFSEHDLLNSACNEKQNLFSFVCLYTHVCICKRVCMIQLFFKANSSVKMTCKLLNSRSLSAIHTVALVGAVKTTPVSLLIIYKVKYFVFSTIMSSITVMLKHAVSFCLPPSNVIG